MTAKRQFQIKKFDGGVDINTPRFKHAKLMTCGIIILFFFLLTSVYGIKSFFDKYTIVSPIQRRVMITQPKPSVKPSATPSPKPQSAAPAKKVIALVPQANAASKTITGKVSYYSHAGCLGCGANQITASGESFDENAMTLAVVPGSLPMGTMVQVTNLDNGKSITAKVNDTGGFAKYNRIADLSLGLYNALGAKTDISNIELKVL